MRRETLSPAYGPLMGVSLGCAGSCLGGGSRGAPGDRY